MYLNTSKCCFAVKSIEQQQQNNAKNVKDIKI